MDDGTTGNSLSQISGATIATLDFANPTAALTISRGNAGDTFAVAALPDFSAALLIGAVGNEFAAVSFAGAVALSADKNLAVTASGTISFTTNASDITTSGAGTITLTTARNISFASGSSLTSAAGDITLTANQNTSPTSGDFAGIDVNGATIGSSSGHIFLIGRGGDGTGGSQVGVFVHGGGIVGNGTTSTITVAGTGGPSAGNANQGVVVADANSMVTSGGGAVSIIARGGGVATSANNDGIDVRVGRTN